MYGSRIITIKTDSQLTSGQIKGNMLVKNIRLTRFVPIVHDLAMHFEVMNIDWIEREQNGLADLVAKSSA
jgi:ribonuclease HI